MASADDVVITYKGSEIASMTDSGTKTLKTSGKYCEDDITVDYTKQGGGAQTVTLIIYDNFGMTQYVYYPQNATWTGFEPDMETYQVYGTLTIPAESMFVITMNSSTPPASSVVTFSQMQILGSRVETYAFCGYVGTSDGTVTVN